MEAESQESLSPAEKSRVWWQGAWKGFFKGIPQGIMLGVLGYALLVGAIYATAALFPPVGLSLAGAFGSFVFANGALTTTAAGVVTAMPALNWATLASFNPLPVIALNTVLTMAGNFLTSGDIAVGDRIQKIDHEANKQQIRQLAGREYLLEQMVSEHVGGSKATEAILSRGARNVQSFVAAEEARAAEVAKAKVLQ